MTPGIVLAPISGRERRWYSIGVAGIVVRTTVKLEPELHGGNAIGSVRIIDEERRV
jgi:hypothetical protein